jgi:hypothetical protein
VTGQTRHTYLWIAASLLVAGSLLQAVAGYTHHDLSGHATGTDDAFISYRYACNLANGDGLTFNPGERVEGYSNFSYVLLMSAACVVAENVVFELSVVINIAISLLALLVFHGLVRDELGEGRAIAAAFLFALSPTIWCWAASGLETSLITLLQLSILSVVQRSVGDSRTLRTGILVALSVVMVLSRVDGFLLPALAVVYLLATGRPRPALTCLAAIAVTFIAHLAFRYGYYADFLPNTYYVKVSGPLIHRISRALVQLFNLALYQGLGVYFLAVGLSVLAALRWPLPHWRKFLERLGFPTLFAVAWVGYFIFIGGDVYKERFLLILYPLGAYLLLRLTAKLSPAKERTAIAATLVLQLSVLFLDVRFGYSFDRYDRWVTLGEFLADEHPDTMIAVDAAGKVPFYSGLRAIDMFGLNDRHIAKLKPEQEAGLFNPGHGKHDADYVLAKHPDLIAGWINPDLQVTGGMSSEKYRAAGYRIRYLVNAAKDSRTDNIVDVRNLGESEIVRLVEDDYNYAVLAK